MFKKTQIAAALLAAASLTGIASTASAQQYVITRVSPPAAVAESVPSPRQGYIWAPGHHEWRGNQFAWVSGQWYRERPGYDFRGAQWIQRNGQWQMVGNDWVRRGPNGDRDHDGIANRFDRDRDGDGISNRRDNRPNHANIARHRFGPNGDLDGDGIRNRNDRDRDGDGVRNNRDRYPDDRSRS
ncbi:MAG: thrombospondin type 3 repeat-containing protein [Ramlibacter sp.]